MLFVVGFRKAQDNNNLTPENLNHSITMNPLAILFFFFRFVNL